VSGVTPERRSARFPGFSLDRKVSLVTGASSGIGFAIAQAMSDAGARVVATGRDGERLRRCSESLGEHHLVAVDLCSDSGPRRVVEETLDTFGALDVLVHSAGIFWPRPFAETPLDEFDEQFRLNVRAPYALTQEALPHLEPGASVIFVSSIAGRVGFPNSAAYCGTKGAVELMTKALAMELAPSGIRVNAIAPGNVHTPMNARFFESPEYERTMIERTPFGRVGVVEDIAPVAVFLASDAARYIHGESILVDGGWAAQ
jgi:NAD(P)-dependent dehydrogenase (short-subunit alcohol dehydrogenase family)